jgi:hypothetical protein
VTTARIAHFAINAENLDETRSFYEAVFGWTFHAWGPPGFFQIHADGERGLEVGPRGGDHTRVVGALQARRDLIDGTKTVGFECTFAVDDVDATAKLVTDNGGRIIMEKTTITGVGDLIWFEDPAGNAVGAMRYDPAAE